jgi:hypothetical protein
MCDLCVRVLRCSGRREEGRVARLSDLLRLLLRLERHTTCFMLLYGLCCSLKVPSLPPRCSLLPCYVSCTCAERGKKMGGLKYNISLETLSLSVSHFFLAFFIRKAPLVLVTPS